MMKRVAVFFVVFNMILAVGIQNASGETFTLKQVYRLALQKAEGIQIAREDMSRAEEEKRRARSTVLPQLTVSGSYDRSPKKTTPTGFIAQPRENYEAAVNLEQPLYAGGKSSAGLRMAQQGIEVAKRDFNLSREALLLRAAGVFYGVLKAQKNLEAQERNVERLKEHRRLSELRYKVGEVTESVLFRAQAELAGAQAERVAVQNDLATQRRELQILGGLPDDFIVEDPLAPVVPEEAVAELLEVALEKREDMQRSRHREKIAQEQVAFARGNFLPTLSLQGIYFYRDQDPQRTFFIQDSWVAGVRLEFPIFEGGLRLAEISQARSGLVQSRLETVRLRKEIDLDITRSFLTLEAVTRSLHSRQEQQRFAVKNYELVSRQFTFGLATNIDLLDANQVLTEAERDVITSSYDRHLAILQLQRSAGVFLSEALNGSQRPSFPRKRESRSR